MPRNPSESWKKKFLDVENEEKELLRRAISSMIGVSNNDTDDKSHRKSREKKTVSNNDTVIQPKSNDSKTKTKNKKQLQRLPSIKDEQKINDVSFFETLKKKTVSKNDTNDIPSVSQYETKKEKFVSKFESIQIENNVSNNDTHVFNAIPSLNTKESAILSLSGNLSHLGLYTLLSSMFPSGSGLISWRKLANFSLSSVNRIRSIISDLESCGLVSTRSSSKGTVIILKLRMF